MLRPLLAFLIITVLAAPMAHAQDESPESLGAAFIAKVLGSAIFVSGREVDDALRDSIYPFLAMNRNAPEDLTRIVIDREAKEVQIAIGDGPVRTARYFGDQGCIIIPMDSGTIHFEPVDVTIELPPADSTPWPMGDAVADENDGAIHEDSITQALDAAFAEGAHTAAFVAVHEGRIIAERYAEGAHMHMPLESWSMGKSLTAALYGRVAHEAGNWNPDRPAPFPEWKNDERKSIRIRDLFNMSSGLKFSSRGDAPDTWGRGHPDHSYIYSGAIDAFAFSLSRPAEHPPATVGRYRNCDPLLVGLMIRRAVEAKGGNYHTFPQRELFDKIGMRNMVLETDPYGNFLLTGYDYGSARDWARLGMLFLNDGVWMGERLLPEGFAEFVSSPAPAWDNGEYGGLFWIDEGSYRAAGQGGQSTIIIPEHDLVIVRMGHQSGTARAGRSTREAVELLVSVIE